jgi:hypothetical protein
VVRPNATGSHKLVPHANRKRQIGQAVTVQVADLVVVHAEFDAAEAMRLGAGARPAKYLALDLFGYAANVVADYFQFR